MKLNKISDFHIKYHINGIVFRQFLNPYKAYLLSLIFSLHFLFPLWFASWKIIPFKMADLCWDKIYLNWIKFISLVGIIGKVFVFLNWDVLF